MEYSQHGDKLPFTGERYIPGVPDLDPPLRAEHLLRHAACDALVRGKRVLDIACGEGHGSAMRAESASRVLSLDISAEAAEHANAAYRGVVTPGSETASATDLPCDNESVDTIACVFPVVPAPLMIKPLLRAHGALLSLGTPRHPRGDWPSHPTCQAAQDA